MSIVAENLLAYAEPLTRASDGSKEGLEKAMNMALICWNLAVIKDDAAREKEIADLQTQFGEEFVTSIVRPMLLRHKEMYPRFHQDAALARSRHVRTFSQPDRYGPCPCKSGKKYKFCCGRTQNS